MKAITGLLRPDCSTVHVCGLSMQRQAQAGAEGGCLRTDVRGEVAQRQAVQPAHFGRQGIAERPFDGVDDRPVAGDIADHLVVERRAVEGEERPAQIGHQSGDVELGAAVVKVDRRAVAVGGRRRQRQRAGQRAQTGELALAIERHGGGVRREVDEHEGRRQVRNQGERIE
jgi:hypothetical protein